MSKHQAPPLSGQILDEATTWFVEFNEGEVGYSAREAFIRWLRTSPEHVRAYLQLTAHWEDVRSLKSIPAIDELVAMAREPTHANVIPISESRPRGRLAVPSGATTRRSRRVLIAASITIAMLGGATMYWLTSQRGVYSTEVGEQRSIQLEDGSTVDLNARSRIRIAFGEHERDVELIEGEALFQVAKDHTRPFIVQSGNTKVRAVGTQFDVYKHQDGTTVTVVEGRVAVFPLPLPATAQGPNLSTGKGRSHQAGAPERDRGASHAANEGETGASLSFPEIPGIFESTTHKAEILLVAGEQITISRASVNEDAHADVKAVTAWTQKQIVFNSTPLSDVVDEFNRYNTRQLVITDPTIANTKITGVFSSANSASLLKGLDSQNRFRIRETPDRIEISSK